MEDEIFGPVLPIIIVASIEEAMRFVRAREKPLAAYLFCDDRATVERFETRLSSGALVVNDTIMHMLLPSLPFGGVGR